jgi:hypothetical protein
MEPLGLGGPVVAGADPAYIGGSGLRIGPQIPAGALVARDPLTGLKTQGAFGQQHGNLRREFNGQKILHRRLSLGQAPTKKWRRQEIPGFIGLICGDAAYVVSTRHFFKKEGRKTRRILMPALLAP